jgi:hypothetical protein
VIRERLKKSYDSLHGKYGKWFPVAFFIAGFIFDAIALQRIDELFGIIQQAVYVTIAAGLIAVELILHERELKPPRWLARLWPYREFLLQFMFGTLLNVYVIFYFKSASALASLGFIAAIGALSIAHEFRKFGRYQTQLHVSILSLCLISYFGLLAPILVGYIGAIPFFGANVAAWFCMVFYRRWLENRLDVSYELLRTHVLFPFAGVQILFVLLYVVRVLPPVPLSASYMGIFHNVEKVEGEYRLTYTRPEEKFWQHGDQTFLAGDGDTIFCFVRIFAPARFKDQLQVRWLYYDEAKGWQSSDAIPLAIVGGREEGYRGVTKKSNYQPGDWRVQIETADGREIGRISFTVEREMNPESRVEKVTVQ